MIKLHQEECVAFMRGMAKDSVDLVIADPPYSSGGMMRGDKMATTKAKYTSSDSGNRLKLPEFLGDNRDQRAFYAWCVYWMEEASRVLKDEAILAVFIDWRQLPTVTDAVQGAGLVWRGIVPWWKPSGRPMSNRFTNQCEYVIWATKGGRTLDMQDVEARYPAGFYKYQPPAQRIHVTEKPVELYRHIYQICKNGSVIYDPFLGSGTSAVAAHIEGRGLQFIGTELSPEVFAVAQQRCAELMQQQTIPFD